MSCTPFWEPVPPEVDPQDEFWEWGLEWGVLRRDPHHDGEGGSE